MMITIVAVVAFLSCFVLFLMVWRDSSGMTLVATPFLAFAGTEMLAMWSATVLRVADDPVQGMWSLLVVVLAFVAFLIGFVTMAVLAGLRRDMAREFRSLPVGGTPLEDGDRHYAIAVLLATAVLIALGAYLYEGLPPQWVAFYEILRGGDIQEAQAYLSEARFLLTKSAGFGAAYRGQGFVLAVMNLGWPFVTGVSAMLYRRSRRKRWLTTTAVLLVLTVTFLGGTGQRGPVVMTVLFLFVLFSLITVARTRHLLLAAGGGMGLLVILTLTSGTSGVGASDGNAALQVGLAAVQRIPKNGIYTLQTIEFVGEGDIPLGWGKYQEERLIQSLPGPGGGDAFCHRLHLLLHPTSTATTCASMTQLGQLYADFGIAGSTIGYFIIGALAATAQRFLFGLRKGPLELPLTALAIMGFLEVALGGIVSAAVYFSLLASVYLSFRVAAHTRIQRRRQRRGLPNSIPPIGSEEIGAYGRIMRRGWKPLGLTIAAGLVVGWGSSALATPHYRATATVLVTQVENVGLFRAGDLDISESLARTLAPLVTSRPVLDRAIVEAGLPITVGEIDGAVRATAVPATQLLRISATAPGPGLAAATANAVARAVIDSDQSRAIFIRPGALSIVDPAVPPARPESPRVLVAMALGALIAGTAGFVGVVIAAHVDDTVRTGDDAFRIAGLRTIGRIEALPRETSDGRHVVTVARDGHDAYRIARTNLGHALAGTASSGRVLLVTSPGAGDGKTTTAANLAVVSGLSGLRVCVVDGNLRRPALHRLFGLENIEGLSTLLTARTPDIQRAIRRPAAYRNVAVVTAGPVPAQPGELLSSSAMADLMRDLRRRFDLVVVDTPAVMAAADAVMVAAHADAALLVIRPGATRAGALRATTSAMAAAGTPVTGVLWNHPQGSRARTHWANRLRPWAVRGV